MSARPSDKESATLYLLASIYDVGQVYLQQTGARRASGLPRTFEEYIAQLYGNQPADRFMAFNYGLLVALMALIVALALIVGTGR